jgi:single-strand DNA-binding protein
MAVNKVILLGNVGRDPDVRYIEGGNVCATFPLATTERSYRTKNGVEVPEKTEWHNIVAWQGIAERMERQVKKGCLIYIEGKLRTRNWTDANNVKHYVTEIFVDQFELLRQPAGVGAAPSTTTPPERTDIDDAPTRDVPTR